MRLRRIKSIYPGATTHDCMDPFPFTQPEWQEVQDITTVIVNAFFADDYVLRESAYLQLLEILDGLRSRHGDHPILRETEADFCDDSNSQLDIYRTAIRLAEDNHLPTVSIRGSLVNVLLNDFNDRARAAAELEACKAELPSCDDESLVQEWFDFMAQVQGGKTT